MSESGDLDTVIGRFSTEFLTAFNVLFPCRSRAKGAQAAGAGAAGGVKGKGRRHIFKKRPAMKAPVAVARAVTSDRVYFRVSFA